VVAEAEYSLSIFGNTISNTIGAVHDSISTVVPKMSCNVANKSVESIWRRSSVVYSGFEYGSILARIIMVQDVVTTTVVVVFVEFVVFVELYNLLVLFVELSDSTKSNISKQLVPLVSVISVYGITNPYAISQSMSWISSLS